MRVTSAESTELFVGPPDAPLQVVRIGYSGAGESESLQVSGDALRSDPVTVARGDGVVEVPVRVEQPVPGQRRAARAGADFPFEFTVAEPGWTMYMISHFHYDPVWWNTQGAYTSLWTEEPPGRARQNNGFALVAAHLEMARRDPDYKFVLAEVDYLKPYFDTRPEDRADLRRFVGGGRVEVMGGTYNEPNTNLVGAETAIRNFVHGIGYQRDVLGADPATAWQLDVFGHDPQFPGMAADAGLTSSSWARGPHHQWGPMASKDGQAGDPRRMQFRSEFEWIAPSGLGLLTHYMPAHYSAGWWMDSAESLAEAEEATYRLFSELKSVALTRNVLLPVGTDYTPPNSWVTEIHRDWNARYAWPRFVCALPSEFFAAVRAETSRRGVTPSPQTRDMNPIYTGKDVSYIDTKQANRAAEDAVLGAERFAVFAALLSGARYPEAALAKAWVQLAYGAHHDGITGSESDQVYLDLLTSWRNAWELGSAARSGALRLLSGAVAAEEGGVVVWNPLAHSRTDIVTVQLDAPVGPGVSVVDSAGVSCPALVSDDGHLVTWRADGVDSLGWRSYRLVASDQAARWQVVDGAQIANEYHRLRVDPARGGGVVSLIELSADRELIASGRLGNELAVYEEYPAHPQAGEGPWHLLPRGPVTCSTGTAADSVQAYRSPLGERLVVTGHIGELMRYTQVLTLWHGIDRVDASTTIDEFTGADRLVRLRWPCPIPGALPVSEVGDAVIGRGFGLMHDHGSGADQAIDSAEHPWTLDNPAHGWFGLSAAARIRVGRGARAMSVAEVVVPAEDTAGARDLMVALVRAGVTATCSSAEHPRYGHLDVDSNLPDTRIALGGPDDNAFIAAVLAAADHTYTAELHRQLSATGQARVWVPAAEPLESVWRRDADLRGVLALPVLVIAGHWAGGLSDAVAAVVDDLDDAQIDVTQDAPSGLDEFEPRTLALLNRGIPGCAVEPDHTLHTSLMRSCTGWPSGVWIDPPRRTVPDESNFALQHWTHTFDFALASGTGDWRDTRMPSRSAEFNHPMVCVVAGEGVGALAADGSLLRIEPAGAVHLAALKIGGNPTATGSAASVDPRDVTIRLVETHGTTTEVAISSDVGRVSAVMSADLLETARDNGEPPLRLHGYQIATLLARLDVPAVLDADGTDLAPDAEEAQPLYARYWLHNRGPAPLGGLPAVAHLHPEAVTAEAGDVLRLRLTAASDCSDAALAGDVRLLGPPGWALETGVLPFELPAGQHREAEIVVRVPPDAPSGDYPIRAHLTVRGDVPAAWRQRVEDVCIVSVGAPGRELVRLVSEPADVVVAAGERSRLAVTVGSRAHTDLALEAHLISPWGTWEWIGPAVRGAVLGARSTAEVAFDIAPPPWVQPGRWWALIRIGCAGRLLYTPAVAVTVR
ncbi:NEW3 domain-containing protein [Mycobacterium sp. CVI_P3]|uniref:NEW3 domain-containing protein n=1 Tax=Mycobacterium pinniadriaticum TaxID=2994102 RepID=A0ABT3SNF0_9MYCO|nr:NEW3 domain-containing protein [Mycobacterium pinniadriaticum]MCX2934618.1 NEW3 domain-containing protein [Mycobacterium pinniadriaticum]MCX2941041.1 NEW3 domain-containing protein [Mycobacterium pinniadriaticum]